MTSDGDVARGRQRAFVLSIAKRDEPRTLKWLGVVVLAFAALNAIVPPMTPLPVFAGTIAAGSGMLALGYVLDRPRVREELVPWAFALALALFVVWLLVVYLREGRVHNLTYVVVAITAFGPLTLAWRPFFVAGALMIACVAVALEVAAQDRATDWLVGALSALAIGGVLLLLRMRHLYELADAYQATKDLSTRDALTGVLNRHGLQDRIEPLWALAHRQDEGVWVCFLDVRGLKRANDQYGHDLGDQVIRDVADAISETVRAADLVARWGGDEFVVVGVGDDPSASSLSDRVNANFVARSAARRELKIGDITVGHANGKADQDDFDALVRAADGDMYRRRRDASA